MEHILLHLYIKHYARAPILVVQEHAEEVPIHIIFGLSNCEYIV